MGRRTNLAAPIAVVLALCAIALLTTTSRHALVAAALLAVVHLGASRLRVLHAQPGTALYSVLLNLVG